MANTSRGRRSRKPRPRPAAASSEQVSSGAGKQTSKPALQRTSRPTPKQPPKPRQKTPPPPTSTLGERPHAPWHPLPLSEILIVIGAIATIVALNNRANDSALLIAGLVAVGLGTFEVTLREHWSGYRSHAILLAAALALVFHSSIVLAASVVANPTVLLSIVLLPFDLALFVFLFRLLRARFLDARQLRALGRR